MGITSITNLNPMPFARSIRADIEPSPMERVENSARTGDETYSPSGGKSAGGSEDDASEEDSDENHLGEFDGESGIGGGTIAARIREQVAQSIETEPPRPISFFA
jgi:hypothetical protein